MIPYRNGLTAYTFYGNWAKPERSSSGAEMGESYPHPLGVSPFPHSGTGTVGLR